MTRLLRKLGITLLTLSGLTLAGLIGAAMPSYAQSEDLPATLMDNMDKMDQAQLDAIWDRARAKLAEAKLSKKARAKLAKERARAGIYAKKPRLEEDMMGEDEASHRPGSASPFGIVQPVLLAPPPNVITNNKVGDGVSAGQAEQHIAVVGQYGLTSWNDGQGFTTPPDIQGVAYTTDGGATWVDVGAPPSAGATGGTITGWNGDPVIAFNKNTGDFYVAGLVNLGTSNGTALVRASFPGGVFTWDTPRVIRNAPDATNAIDKEWITCDPLTGNLYCTYTDFNTTNFIRLQRSTDNGATWSAGVTVSDVGDNGRVQGSRPEVDAAGNLYVTYTALLPANPLDCHRVKKSTDGGLTFGAAATAVTFIPNFGAGGPAFNRLRSIDNPSIYVDRSGGPDDGRAFIAYQNCIDVFNDPINTLGPISEVENNNFFSRANPFAPGNTLRGSLAGTGGFDYYSFPATQGTTHLFQTDSLSAMFYTMRIFCSDTTTLLNSSGDNSGAAGGLGSIFWTAPANGTYYLRIAVIAGGTNGGYRVSTGTNVNASVNDVARDHRDVCVAYSDGGAVWSTPGVVNDDPPYYDNWLPEVAASNEGYVYAMWYDWRDSAVQCGGRSHIYATRSTDGGSSWAANKIISTAQTNWTTTLSNIAPNQGDYNGMFALDVVSYNWADGRLGDVDAWAATHATGVTANCPPDPAPARPEDPVLITFGATNPDVVWDGIYDVVITSERNWPGFPIVSSPNIPGGGTVPVNANFSVPDTSAVGFNRICFIVRQPNGLKPDTCCVTLEILDRPVAALASLVSAHADGGRATLAWWVSTSDPVAIYRSSDATSWDLMATRTPDASGRIEFVDASISGAGRYGYRLGLRDGTAEVPAGEVWLDVNTVSTLQFLGARPNPTKGPFSLSFALPSAGRATLELIDLSGRRVVSRDVGLLGAGVHVVNFDREAATLPVGIYTVRLTQGGRVVTGKVSILK